MVGSNRRNSPAEDSRRSVGGRVRQLTEDMLDEFGAWKIIAALSVVTTLLGVLVQSTSASSPTASRPRPTVSGPWARRMS
jgi:hypothetical protein